MINRISSMLELHDQELEIVDEAFHDFLLIYRKDAEFVYGFVEGKDDPLFYRDLIQKELPPTWSIKLIPAGNKEKVLQSYNSFDWNKYDIKRICFFIDRDLQDFLEKPIVVNSNIYVTDGYSIENSVLFNTNNMLINILSDIYGICLKTHTEEELIKKIVKDNENDFFDAIIALMGQILIWRREGKKANLSNLNLDKIFSFSQGQIRYSNRNTILHIAAKHIGCNLCNDDEIVQAENELIRYSNGNHCMIIRGKYLLWLFYKNCEAIWNAIPVYYCLLHLEFIFQRV